MDVIDSHHHLWRYTAAEYGWIPHDWSPLRRDFLPADLHAATRAAGVTGVVTVQARQTREETEWLLDLAKNDPLIRGVVGWVPLIDPNVDDVLDELIEQPKFRAARHVLQGEPDDGYMLRADFHNGIRALTARNLAYDILILERQLPPAVTFVDRHPEQVFVVDHIAKPRIAAGEIEPWARNLRELARRPHVACKISGFVTEANVHHWTPGQLHPYFEVALEAFGPDRLLFGSDWPVCLAGIGYSAWKHLVDTWMQPLSADERAAILGGNAVRLYRLS